MAKDYKINTSFTYEGKRYFIHADTKAELAVKKALKLRDLQEGKVSVSGNMTVKDWAEKCIATYKTKQKEITRKNYEYKVNHYILEHIGNMQLKKVKPIHCQEVMNLQIGKSKAIINDVYQALNFIFRKAVENKLILENPAEHVVKPQGTKTRRRAITESERNHILKVAKMDRRYYLYLLMLLCGCRPSEAAECMGKDIIIMEGYPVLHIRGTKTANADRYVPIPDELYLLIRDTPKDEFIAQYNTGGQIKYDNRKRLWDSFKRQLNLSMGCKTYRNKLIPPYPLAPDLSPYCLRHTYCTDLARKGIDIRIAQKLMGHSSIELTANIYTHIDNTDLMNVAKILNGSGERGCTEGGATR